MINIIFLAPPASGKGTQASLLKEKYDMAHISTGDLLRNACKKDDEISTGLKQTMLFGNLVDDKTVIKLLEDELKNLNRTGFILDGFPRNINQAIELDNMINKIDLKINFVIYLHVDKDILRKRVVGRRICNNCGKIYNIYTDNINNCDCGGQLYQREDDNIESFNIRYTQYMEQTLPLIDYYDKKNLLVRIDATDDIDKVFDRISSIIEGDLND